MTLNSRSRAKLFLLTNRYMYIMIIDLPKRVVAKIISIIKSYFSWLAKGRGMVKAVIPF